MTQERLRVDALVVGGGIAGMQASLDLADQGYRVALVEREILPIRGTGSRWSSASPASVAR